MTGRSVRPLRPAPARAAALGAVVVYLGYFTSRNVSEGLWAGRPASLSAVQPGILHYTRDLALFVLTGAVAYRNRHRRWPGPLPGRTMVVAAAFFAFLIVRDIIEGSFSATGVAATVRSFAFLVLAWAISVTPMDWRRATLRRFEFLTFPFLALQVVEAVRQVMSAPPTSGVTAFGSRTWGTYGSSNILGLTLVGFGLLATLGKNRFWRARTLVFFAVALTTGSRSSIVGLTLIILAGFSANRRVRARRIRLAVVLAYPMYLLTRTRAVSGRAIDSEGRFVLWSKAFRLLTGPEDWLLGAHLGAASNASAIKNAGTESANISDSLGVFVILSTGLAGLALCVALGIHLARRVRTIDRWVLLPSVGLAALTFNIGEVSPFNLCVGLAIGYSCMASDDQDAAREDGGGDVRQAPQGLRRELTP